MENESYLYLTEAVEWMRIDADHLLFSLNMLILITVGTVSRLLRLVCWQLLSTTALLSYKVALDKEDDRVA